MSGRIDIDAIRRDWPVAKVAGAVVKLRPVHGELRGCCPFHEDRSPSFYIYEGGQRWICFAGCGEGDVLDFIQKQYGGSLRDAAERLYGGDLPVVEAPKLERKDRARSVDYARELWVAAGPIMGTPAEAYLRSRGITAPLPPVLRFARLAPPKDSGLAASSGNRPLPALVALVTAHDARPTGIQRTYLTDAGRKALSADGKVKFSLGNIRGGAVRLGPEIAEGLALTEGIEDALSLMQLGAPSAWAAAGSAMLDGMVLPEGVRSVVVGGDNDAAGRAAAEKAARAFAGTGRIVELLYPDAPFKDFNDELRASAATGRVAA